MTDRDGDTPKSSLVIADIDGSLTQRAPNSYNANGFAKAIVRFVLGQVPARAPSGA